jgi:parvulin-like peptidyl-prolyl isomerase
MLNPKFIGVIILSLFCLGSLVMPGFAQDKIIAVVNKEIITQKDLEGFLNYMRMQLSEQYKGAQLEEKIRSMKPDLLERLIEDRLILQEAKKNNISIDTSRMKAKINEMKQKYGSEQAFQEALKGQGLVEADLESRIKEQMSTYNIIEAKIKDKIVVKPAEITDFYNNNLPEFIFPEQRDLESLVVEDEAMAKNIAADLKSGKDINEVAKIYSLKVNSFSVRREELKKEIEDALFKLNKFEAAGPMRIKDSFYVFRLVGINLPRQQVLAEVQDRIYELLYEKKMQEDLARWVEELKKAAYIKMVQE